MTAMKTFSILLLTAAGLCSLAYANVPKKEPLVKYTGLWTNSPFTSKPPVIIAENAPNILDDYTLTGIAPVPGGYRINIMSKKDPNVKEVIEPGKAGKFSVVSVNRNPGTYLGTTVVLSTGSVQGTVSFEKELLTLKAPPAPKPPQQGNLPPGITPAQANPQDPNAAQRQPRPRIVPPPATPNAAGTKQQQPTNKDGRDRSSRRGR